MQSLFSQVVCGIEARSPLFSGLWLSEGHLFASGPWLLVIREVATVLLMFVYCGVACDKQSGNILR